MKKKGGRIICVFLLLYTFLLSACGISDLGKVTETFDLSDYGKFDGITPSAKDYVQKEFQRYFPQTIPSTYENVHYHFATTDDGSAYEIILEFIVVIFHAIYYVLWNIENFFGSFDYA